MAEEMYDKESLYPLLCSNCKTSLGWVAVFSGNMKNCMFLCETCSELPYPLSKVTLHSQEKSLRTHQ